MVEYLTHYYKRGSLPFRSLSALTEPDALRIMENLSDDSPIFSRFKQPIKYMVDRKETEKWLRDQFIQKGGQPIDEYPQYAVLGASDWIEKRTFTFDIDRIQIPLSLVNEYEISFTYPDSMVSYALGKDQPAAHYQAEYHGQVFTLTEARVHLMNHTTELLEKRWTFSEEVIPYIEAQIWNHKTLLNLCGY